MRCVFESPNCLKCNCNLGSAPDPVEVAYSSTPNPLYVDLGRRKKRMTLKNEIKRKKK